MHVKWNEIKYDRKSATMEVAGDTYNIHPRFWKGFTSLTMVNQTIFNLFSPEEVLERMASSSVSSISDTIHLHTEGEWMLAPSQDEIPKSLILRSFQGFTSLRRGLGHVSGFAKDDLYGWYEMSAHYDGLNDRTYRTTACISTSGGPMPCTGNGLSKFKVNITPSFQPKGLYALIQRHEDAKNTVASLGEIRTVLDALAKLGYSDGFTGYCQDPFGMYGISENTFSMPKLSRLPSQIRVADLLSKMAQVCERSHHTRLRLSQIAGVLVSRQFDMEGCDPDRIMSLLHGIVPEASK